MKEKILIINADDFGLHKDINLGIARTIESGMVRNVSISSCGKAYEHGISLQNHLKSVDIGVHITLVGEKPISYQGEVKSLVNINNLFVPGFKEFSIKYFLGKLNFDEVYLESKRQIERVFESGLTPVHLDSHQHIHILPKVWDIFCQLAIEFNIPFIRLSTFNNLIGNRKLRDIIMAYGCNILTKIDKFKSSTGEINLMPTIGLAIAGKLTAEKLQNLLKSVKPGVVELVIHPGNQTPELENYYPWNYNWQEEQKALTDTKILSEIESKNIKLGKFTEI